jgi:hypothetical protein
MNYRTNSSGDSPLALLDNRVGILAFVGTFLIVLVRLRLLSVSIFGISYLKQLRIQKMHKACRF